MTATGDVPHSSGSDVTRSSKCRLLPQPGEWIDRERPLSFRFEDRTYSAFAGDTISSALAANGVRLLGRSFKYHRPRGIYSMANHDVNVLVSDGNRTNIRADVTAIWDGAELAAINTFGGLENDQARRFDRIGRFLPVGFYYKTFHKPKRLFPFWERQMRAMAGLGAVDPKAPRLCTAKQYDWCDLLVVGGGASGLSAAIAAAEQGLQVIVADEQPHLGGSLSYQRTDSAAALKSLVERAAALPNLSIRSATVAAGYYADNWLALVDEHRLTKVRAKSVVFATGAFEQPALFRNNDLPGVMVGSAAQRLIRLYAVKPFARPVVLTANVDGYWAALEMSRAGIAVRMIVDLRPSGEPTDVRQAAVQAGIVVRPGHCVYEAISAGDATGIDAVVVCPFDEDGQPRAKLAERIECDGLVMSVGWAPADSLFCQAGGKMKYSRELEQFVPDLLPPGVFVAGRLNGVFAVDTKITDGRRAGLAAAAHLGRYAGTLPETAAKPATPPSHAYPVVDHPVGKIFVDLDEDVQLKDIKHAVQEGFDNVELLKRYSTFGMGPSQGKIANTNTIRVLAHLRGETMGDGGSPTARPFFHPVPLSHLAGKGFHPHRETALQSRHESLGAVFMPAGDWRRPAYYESSVGSSIGQSVGNALRGIPQRSDRASTRAPRNATEGVPYSSRDAAVAAEVAAVRERVGLIDVSTLGKLEITGPDAAEFLERIYTGRFAKMKVGTTRYGLMCDESGVIIDDGVIGRLADDRFYLTTTTTASGSVYREMQRWALLWKLKVVLANLTGPVAAMNLAGPAAPAILAALCDLDLSEAGFPYLGLREAMVLDVPARVLRTGFVGEVGYEIHVPARAAPRVWDAILDAGTAHGIMPFGVEAQRVLRLEKGHVIVSQDTDGLTTPFEAGMEWAVRHDKPFFIGGRSLQIVARKPLKRRLVGFTLPRGYEGPLPRECHLIIEKGEIVGRVTSIADSATLGQPIGMAYVAPHQSEPGSEFQIRVEGGKMVTAKVVELPFYDRNNARQRAAGWSRRAGDGWVSAIEAPGVRHQASGADSDELSITDLSHLDRVVLKGPAAAELLVQHRIDVPGELYEHRTLADDGLIVRTGTAEFFLEDSEDPGIVRRLREVLQQHRPGLLSIWRQDVSLVISGSKATELLSQLASFNFGAAGEVFVMTQIAGVSCSVLGRQRSGRPSWQIWADGSYGSYLSEAFETVKQRNTR